MSNTLYRKYRPKTFKEVEGQDHVVRTIEGAIVSDRVGQAYLFAGPRGTGKTTIARLFAKSVNCTSREKKNHEPCNECFSCQEINEGRSMDIIEIDAASNRGIDEMRSLKDSAQVSATSSNFKIFIVDEVHMLTTPAFNALLKTLEEPPSHVIFILATTESHKIPETILSRVQRFDFKKISHDKMIQKLKKIAKIEKVEIDDTALTSIASNSDGSFRDAESAFAKLISYAGNKITAEDAVDVLGIIPLEAHQKLLHSIKINNRIAAIAEISSLYESGIDLDNFVKQFIKFLRHSLVELLSHPKSVAEDSSGESQLLVRAIVAFIKAKEDMKNSIIPQLPLELAVIDLTFETNERK